MERHDAIVVGGGPVGLRTLSLLLQSGIEAILLEAKKGLGGQLEGLYPEKGVDDVEGFPPMKAHDLFLALLREVDPSKVRIGEKIESMEKTDDGYSLVSTKGNYQARAVFLATGYGTLEPRRLGLHGESKAKNVLYALVEIKRLQGKKVAIFGGGDSALDWAKELSSRADVNLVHRRDEFRGDACKIDGLPLKVWLSYVPDGLRLEGDEVKEVIIKSAKTGERVALPVDYVLVNFGLVPSGLELPYPKSERGFGYLTDANGKLDEGLYAVGDVSYRDGKRKRMDPGFREAERAVGDYLKGRHCGFFRE